MLSPALLGEREQVREALHRQPYVVLDNALLPDVAEALREELLSFDGWEYQDHESLPGEVQEYRKALSPEYSFRRRMLQFDSASLPPMVEQFRDYLLSEPVREWMAHVSGHRCDDFEGAAALMESGDHIREHTDYDTYRLPDGRTVTRALTFNYYLTRDWRSEWGGAFVWKMPPARMFPVFNQLVMFRVGQGSTHSVEPVGPEAQQKRLAITGWFRTIREAVKLDIPGL